MTKLPINRLLLSAALASTLGVTGCDVSDSPEDTPHSSVAYTGCGVVDIATGNCLVLDGTVPPQPGGSPYYMPGTHPRFTPAANDIPLNTDLLFSGSTDGTAKVTPAIAGSPNPVEAGINGLDGWSTTAAFDIGFSAAIDPATVNDGTNANPLIAINQNVFLVPLETTSGGDPLKDVNTGAPFSPANVAATKYITQVTSQDGGSNNTLRVAPTRPLFGPKKYLVIVTTDATGITNGIKDVNGDPITQSTSYYLLRPDAAGCETNGINDQLLPLCDAINKWEQLAVGYLQARNTQINTNLGSAVLSTNAANLKASLALTYTFTTTDPLTSVIGMGAPRAAIYQTAVAAGVPPATAAGFISTNSPTGIKDLLPTPKARTVSINSNAKIDIGYLDGNPSGGALSNGVGTLYTGAITIPYYQTAPANATDGTFIGKHWSADTTLGAALGAALSTDPLPPADADQVTHNVTYRYPFAAKTTDLTIPLQVTVPTAGCAASGCPVAIYVHGITSDRTSVAALAYNLAANGVATVAIDLPLHGVAANSSSLNYFNVESHGNATQDGTQTGLYGDTLANLYPGIVERHFNFRLNTSNGAAVPMSFASPTSADGSGSLYINLTSFGNSHDNLRESVMDLMNLNASLQNVSNQLVSAGVTNGLNLGGMNPLAAQVYVVGVSLGGIVSSTYTAANQAAIAKDFQVYAATSANPAFFPTLYPVKALTANVAGGELTKLLENSYSFAPTVLGGLDGSDGAVDGAGTVQGSSNLEKYMYVLQSAVDSGDPANFVSLLTSSQLNLTGSGGPDLRVPTLLQEIVGGANLGDGAYPSDLVVPNNAYPTGYQVLQANYATPVFPWLGGIPAPLAGTDGLINTLGLTTAAADGVVAVGAGKAAVAKLSIGYHSSLLTSSTTSCATPLTCPSAGNALATGELQTEVVSFILSGGAQVATGTAGSNAAAPYTTTYTN